MVIGVTISNSGELPLALGLITLKVKRGFKYTTLKRAAFNHDIEKIQFSRDSGEHKVSGFTSKDLHKSMPNLAPNNSVVGFLTYITNKDIAEFIAKEAPTIRFDCKDGAGRKYRVKYSSKHREVDLDEAFPRFGLMPHKPEQGGSRQPM